ncbi:MAG: cellulase family glycosylhydrolase [Desulfurococcales archaeon]|nr:cellulase family glycosylhydrolase [Desulfurococcales archaeon]
MTRRPYYVVVVFSVITVLTLVLLMNGASESSTVHDGGVNDHYNNSGSLLNVTVYYEVRGDTIYMINTSSGEEKPIHLYGVNWFGFETPDHVVHGLWARNWEDMLVQIKELGFNAIRLPFCTDSVQPGTMPSTIDYSKNPDLQGLTSLEIMEKIINKSAELGIFILLDYHRIGCNYIEPLWYTDSFTEQDYINTWISVAERFGKYWNVIGADLKNEPHSVSQPPWAYTDGTGATWGMNNNQTDWNLAAERIGRAILEVAPHWLIFVEGTQYTNPTTDGSYQWGYNTWWGGNLMAVRDYPVNLPRNKLVYTPHVYGPDVYNQPYFNDPNFPENLPDIWYHHFGYVKIDLGYPVVIGEFGGRYGHGGDPRDVDWQNKLIDWMIENNFCDFFYWSWNPNSGDTGGILKDDWTNIWEDKYQNLKRLMDHCSSTEGTIAAYYLQNINASKIEWHRWSVLVLEPDETTSHILEVAKNTSDLVLAYLNIGYAEDWRGYWQNITGEPWVHGQTGYPGEYYVEYWRSEWHSIMKNLSEDYLQEGFDGVYLDNIDASEIIHDNNFSWASGVDTYIEMINLVCDISGYIKSINTNAKVYVNIGGVYHLLYNETLLSCIDGVLREELWTVWEGYNQTTMQDPSETNNTLNALHHAGSNGLTVIVVDPVKSSTEAMNFCERSWSNGFIPVPQPAWSPDYDTPPLKGWCSKPSSYNETPTNPTNATITFSKVDIIPTKPEYEGRSSTVTCDGMQCCSSVWGCPNLWGVVQIGNATMDPNVWGWQDRYQTNPGSIGCGSTTMKVVDGRVAVDSVWQINSTPLYNVMAYHEVIYGAKPWGNQPVNAPNFILPMKVKDLPRVLVGTKYTQYNGTPGNNYAFEAWILTDANNNRAPGSGDYEIMVQLYIEGGFPAGYDSGPVAVFDVPIIVDGVVVNQTFELYDVVADPGWRFLTFKSTVDYVNRSVVFDYTYFIELANQYLGGNILDNLYLMSLEFGTEVYTNNCQSFPCQVNITWILEEYYYALAPRNVSAWEAIQAWAQQLGDGSNITPTTPVVTLTSNTTSISQGEPVLVEWSIVNATGWESNIATTPTGSLVVNLNETTTFYIYAWNDYGSVNKTLTIIVISSGGGGGGAGPGNVTNNTITIRYPDEQWPTAEIDIDGDGVNEYVIEINPWNINSASGYAEMTYYLDNTSLHYVQHLDNIVLRNPGSWVHGYPEIFYGNKPWNTYMATDGEVPLPSRVGDLNNFHVTVSYKLNPEPGLPVNLAIESWLTREPWRTTGVNADEEELMIWLYYDGLQPAGSKVGEIAVPIIVNGTQLNATFEVWKAFIGWEYIAFRITTPIKAGTVTLPYSPFISTALNITDLTNYTSLYLEDVEVGTEFGSPSTTSAHMEWWIYELNLTYTNEPLITTPPPPGGGSGGQPGATSGALSVELVNSWGSGAQYDVDITLDNPDEWVLKVKIIDGTITDSWGATVNGTDGDYIVLVAEEWNLGPTANVGFITSGSNPLVTEILLLVDGVVLDNWTAPQPNESDMSVELVIDSEWSSGFVAKIYITNNGDTPISGWYVEIYMTSNITSIWGASYEYLGNNTFKLKPVGYTSVIEPGETIEVGFVAEKHGDHPLPEIVEYGIEDNGESSNSITLLTSISLLPITVVIRRTFRGKRL